MVRPELLQALDVGVVGVAGVALAATLRHVWRGGRTWNDHLVAALVTGCLAVYPITWVGGRLAGAAGWVLLIAVLAGVFGVWVLFAVLDTRREQDRARPAVLLSQVAYAYSLWVGLFVLGWWLACAVGWGAFGVRASLAQLLFPWPLFLVAGGLSTWGVAWTWLGRDTVRVVAVPTPAGRRPLRVVQLSDLHASPTTTGRDLRRTVRTANGLAPDLVVVTGDLVMPFSEAHHPWLLAALAELEAPVAVCPGNHDLPVAERLQAELEALGIHWLADAQRVVILERPDGPLRVELVGVDFVWRDLRGHVARLVEALPAAPAVEARILLLHDPRGFDGVPPDRFELVLCGHTHGGQVGTDMFGWPGSVLGWMGHYDQERFVRGRTHMWVHRGSWHLGLPPRMGIASEVVAFDLRPPVEAPPE